MLIFLHNRCPQHPRWVDKKRFYCIYMFNLFLILFFLSPASYGRYYVRLQVQVWMLTRNSFLKNTYTYIYSWQIKYERLYIINDLVSMHVKYDIS